LSTYEPHGAIVVYSVTDKNSFRNAAEILRYLWQEGFTQEKAVILVGNKSDLARARIISIHGKKGLIHPYILLWVFIQCIMSPLILITRAVWYFVRPWIRYSLFCMMRCVKVEKTNEYIQSGCTVLHSIPCSLN